MRYILALVALVLPTSLFAGALPPSELSIGGITSGATETSVLKHLGQPTKRLDAGEGIELHYPGLSVTVGWLEQKTPGRQRRVLALYGTGSKACTPRGLCPGQPASTADRLYGRTKPVHRESGTYLEYQPSKTHCWLQVAVKGGVIQSVAVACQP